PADILRRDGDDGVGPADQALERAIRRVSADLVVVSRADVERHAVDGRVELLAEGEAHDRHAPAGDVHVALAAREGANRIQLHTIGAVAPERHGPTGHAPPLLPVPEGPRSAD